MAKEDLDSIKYDLKRAGEYQRKARRTAERVGDSSGAQKIREAEKKNTEVIESFPKDL